jgi:cytidylate kinase
MNVLTITRDFGAGGYETARRLAETLGWELLDRALLHQAAAVENLPDEELERLDEKAVSLGDRFRLHSPHQRYLHGLREAALQAAARGNVVLVGRGTGHLLADVPNVLHVRLVAPKEWRAQRMMTREGWTGEQALARCTEEDHNRERFTRYFFGEAPFQPARYHLTFNTARVPLDDVVATVAALVRQDWAFPEAAQGANAPRSPQRVLTLTPELGAGETSFAPALAARLALRVHDRDVLQQEAERLGLSQPEVEKIDERPSGIFQRFQPNSLSQRYFEALGQILRAFAEQGDALLVGRGGNCFLREYPGAFHVRLVAPMTIRVRRVMQHRWLNEEAARKLIAESDARRGRFQENYFGIDWTNAEQYHLTANSGLLGHAAVDAIAFAAGRHWANHQTSAAPPQ